MLTMDGKFAAQLVNVITVCPALKLPCAAQKFDGCSAKILEEHAPVYADKKPKRSPPADLTKSQKGRRLLMV